MKLKKLLSLALALGLASSLAACSSQGTSGASPTPAGSDPAPTADTTLNVLIVSDLEPLEPVFQEFAQANGISIQVESVPYAEIFNTIEVRLGAGESSIDVLVADAPLITNYAAKNYLGSMSEYISADSTSRITSASLAGGTVDGEIMALPLYSSCVNLYYNKDLFEQAGIEAPEVAYATWDEFFEACDKLKEAGITPITADDAYMTSFIGMHLARYIGQDGVKSLVTGEASNDVTVTWDDPKVLAAAESFADFADKGYFSKNIATNKYPAGQNQEFAPGEAAIVICGSWLPNEAKESVADDLEWGYFNYPSVPDGTDDSTANNIANQVFAINKDSRMADEAFELITYITTGEFDKKMTEEALCIPTDKANSDAWPTELAGVKEGFDATTTYYDWAAGVESNNDLTPVLQQNTLDLAAGKIDAAGFIKAMTKAAGQ
mgnify:CR=1 FL=1